MQDTGTLYKTPFGFVWDSGDIFTWELHYDQNGRYIGQKQDNVIDPEGPACFFYKAEMIDGVPCVNGKPAPSLTPEQMAAAAG